VTTAAVFGFTKGKVYKSDHDGLAIWWHEAVDSLRSLDPSKVDVIVSPYLYSVFGRRGVEDIDTSHLRQLAGALSHAAESGVACCLLIQRPSTELRGEIPTCLGDLLLGEDGIRSREMTGGLIVDARFVAAGADVFREYFSSGERHVHRVFDFPEGQLPVAYLILAQGSGHRQDTWGFAVRKGRGLLGRKSRLLESPLSSPVRRTFVPSGKRL
jgi:hypothetical protein